jgi:hypothetical protein
MFTSSLSEEVKALEEDIESVKDKVDDPVMCEKIRQFVYAPREIQDMFKADAGQLISFLTLDLYFKIVYIIAEEKLNIITVVLRSGDEPLLTRPQMQRVLRAHRAHTAYAKYREALDDSDDDDGPEDDDAWLFEDLKLLTQLYSRLRDREQIIALIFEVSSFLLLCEMVRWLTIIAGRYCRAAEGYPYDILCASCSSLSGR